MVGFLWLLPSGEWLLHKNKWKEEREIYEKKKKNKVSGYCKLKKKNWVFCLPPFRLTPHWIRGRVACLPSLGWGSWFMLALHWAGKVVYGYFLLGDLVSGLLPLGERVGCMNTPRWGSG